MKTNFFMQKLGKMFMMAVVLSALAGVFVLPALAEDTDNDGVEDAIDLCPDTAIPEGIPKKFLGFRRFALTDDDTTFNKRRGESSFTLEDTGGCSCEQIIELSGL